jgi:hypothetical protein
MSEDKARKRIFGPERDEVTGGSRTLHDEELHSLGYYDYRVKEARRDNAEEET